MRREAGGGWGGGGGGRGGGGEGEGRAGVRNRGEGVVQAESQAPTGRGWTVDDQVNSMATGEHGQGEEGKITR